MNLIHNSWLHGMVSLASELDNRTKEQLETHTIRL